MWQLTEILIVSLRVVFFNQLPVFKCWVSIVIITLNAVCLVVCQTGTSVLDHLLFAASMFVSSPRTAEVPSPPPPHSRLQSTLVPPFTLAIWGRALPCTAWHFEMSVTLNHIRFDGERPEIWHMTSHCLHSK